MPRIPHRTVRIPDELWQAAQAKAEAEGRTISDVIRDYLKRWTAQPRRKQ